MIRAAVVTSETARGPYQPLNTGRPVTHEIRFYGARVGDESYARRGVVAECECGDRRQYDGGHTDAELRRMARQHAGIEDP